jgi:uncharacterized protein (TIGR02118 family)
VDRFTARHSSAARRFLQRADSLLRAERMAPLFVCRITSDLSSQKSVLDRRSQVNMVKLVYCVTKKAGLTDDEFFRYWEKAHGPIGARIPGLRKLVQSHRLTVSGDKHRPDYDGMAELWFDDVEALLAARQSPEWKSSSEDEVNFIDHSKVAYFVSEERTILNDSQIAKDHS